MHIIAQVKKRDLHIASHLSNFCVIGTNNEQFKDEFLYRRTIMKKVKVDLIFYLLIKLTQ